MIFREVSCESHEFYLGLIINNVRLWLPQNAAIRSLDFEIPSRAVTPPSTKEIRMLAGIVQMFPFNDLIKARAGRARAGVIPLRDAARPWFSFLCLVVLSVLLLCGVFVLFMPTAVQSQKGVWTILYSSSAYALSVYLTLILFVFLHELGHCWMAWEIRSGWPRLIRPIYIRIGGGPDSALGFSFLGIPLRLGSYPFAGRAEFGMRTLTLPPWKIRLIAAGGLGMNMLSGLSLFWFFRNCSVENRFMPWLLFVAYLAVLWVSFQRVPGQILTC